MQNDSEQKLGTETSSQHPLTCLEIAIHGQRLRYLLDLNAPGQRFIFENCQDGLLYEAASVLTLDRFLKPGDRFIDVGAHVGFFTVIAAAMVGPGGRVVAFEPERKNFAALQRNVEINSLTNVVLINAAVGEREGPITLYENLDNDGGHALWPPSLHPSNTRSKLTSRSCRVNQVTVDGASERIGLDRIDAMKIDTEGAEVRVVNGAEKQLKRGAIHFVICEHCRFGLEALGARTADLLRGFYSAGFRGYLSTDGLHFVEVTFDADFEPQGTWIDYHSKYVDNIFFIRSDVTPAFALPTL